MTPFEQQMLFCWNKTDVDLYMNTSCNRLIKHKYEFQVMVRMQDQLMDKEPKETVCIWINMI